MNIRLHIEKLVLESAPDADVDSLSHGFRTELSRLLAENGLAASLIGGAPVASLPAVDMPLSQQQAAGPLGHSIARAVYKSIGNERETAPGTAGRPRRASEKS